MKKILFVALAATLLAAGCQKTEVINPVGNAINFATGMSKLTKADAAAEGTSNLQDQEFRVWAYADYEDLNTEKVEKDNIYDGIANMNVDYTPGADGAEGTWAPVKQYYWPGVNKNLRFFAVSGANLGDDLSAQETVAIAINKTGEGDAETVAPTLTINNYTVNNASPNADLMVADFVCQNQSNKEVNLIFRHTLAKVEFLFKTTTAPDADVFVQSVLVENVNTTATLVVRENTDEATAAAKPMVFTWGTATAPKPFTDDYNETDDTFPTIAADDRISEGDVDNKAMKLTNDANVFTTWLVMPQSIADYQVKVRYVIGVREFESIFPLYTEKLTAWAPNQYVRYTVTLAPNLISFNPSVKDWDQYDADDATDGKQDIEMEN